MIDADGDGIDSNGYVSMTGGTVVINGPNSGRDSAMDHNGTFDMSGGTLIGTNTDGQMSEGIDAGTQASLYVTTQTEVAAGTMIHIETSDGDDVVTFEASKSFSVIVFSSPDLVAGDTYSRVLRWHRQRRRCRRPLRSRRLQRRRHSGWDSDRELASTEQTVDPEPRAPTARGSHVFTSPHWYVA